MSREFLNSITLRGFLNILSGSDYAVEIFRDDRCLLWGQEIPDEWLDSLVWSFEVSYDHFQVFVEDGTVDEFYGKDEDGSEDEFEDEDGSEDEFEDE